jgi:transcription initiation factor IIE alpha subunit
MSIKLSILKLMQRGVELTADEIAGAMDLPVLSIRPRVTELGNAKLLSPVGVKNNRRGNAMTIWTRNYDREESTPA